MVAAQPHIVIVGGAYAGLSALNSLLAYSNGTVADDDAAVIKTLRTRPKFTLIDERDGFYHTVGAPLGQISTSHAREFWVTYKELMSTKYASDPVDFAHGSATELNMESKMLHYRPFGSGETKSLSYDYLLLATGMRRSWPVVPTSLTFDDYMKDATRFEEKLAHSSRIVVVGGGACGIEMSGEIKAHWPTKEVILVHSGPQVLNREPLPDEFKDTALQLLQTQGVDVRLETRVLDDKTIDQKHRLTLSKNETLDCDTVIYSAVQQGANTAFLPSSTLGDQGCVRVRDTFQFPADSPNADVHYAVGDAALWPSIKRSGPAMNQAKHAATNIMSALAAVEDGTEAKLASSPTVPFGMTLSVGDYAMSNRGGGVRHGKEMKLRAFGTGLGIDGTLSNLGLRPRKVQAGL